LKPIRFLPGALEDAAEAEAWYARQRAGLDEEFRGAVIRTLETLSAPESFPVIGRHGRHELRRAVVRRFLFRVLFVDQPERILVVAIAHARRRAGDWRGRS
jgi:plasmid stabilization system protein ParE